MAYDMLTVQRRRLNVVNLDAIITYSAGIIALCTNKPCGVVFSRDRLAIPFDIGRSNCLVAVVGE